MSIATRLTRLTAAIAFLQFGQVRAQTEAASDTRTLPIRDVTVYEDRALVTRAGDVPVPAGPSRVILGGIPAAIQVASLRAAIEQRTGVRVVSVSTRTEERTTATRDTVRSAEEAVEELERSLARLQAGNETLIAQQKMLRRYEAVAATGLAEQATLGTLQDGALEQVTAFFPSRGAALAESQRRVSEEMKDLEEELGDANAHLQKVSTRRAKTVRFVTVDVAADAAATVPLALSYLVRDCGWQPRYDARLRESTLRVTYQGEVRQKTGEDWTHVTMALSTARPALGAQRPRLLPLRMKTVAVDPNTQRGVGGALQLVPREAAADDAPDGTPYVPPVPGAEDDQTVSDSGTSVVFRVPGQADVPSDGRAHRVVVARFADPAPRLGYETVPELMRYVYLRCDSSNKSEFPMLAGAVDIWRESGFVGTSRTGFVAPGRTLSLSLGIDENLKVKRVLDKKLSTTKAVSGKRVHRRAYDVELANYRSEVTEVVVREHIPVSDVAEATVRLDPRTTPPHQQDDKRGFLTWKVALEPEQKRRLHLEYEVTLPKGVSWQP